MASQRIIAERIFSHALQAVMPARLVENSMQKKGQTLHVANRSLELEAIDCIYIIAIGKAAAPMAQAAEAILGDRVQGIVLTKYQHGLPLRNLKLIEAAHPVPDENGLEGTRQIRELLSQTTEKDLVLVLLSGGGSALLADVPPGCSLTDLQQCFDVLLQSGADIEETNTIRKHLSAVKGGQLARAAAPAQVVTLVLSDVIGDKLEVIASGPTVADPTTFADAWDIILKYNLLAAIPGSVLHHLQNGKNGLLPETPKPNNPIFDHTFTQVIGSNRIALKFAKEQAEQLGYTTEILTDSLHGEAREIAQWLVAQAQIVSADTQKPKPYCLLAGGETTVTIRGNGLGGRNQELALAAAIALEHEPNITLLAAGTDGTDGPTDAAGAIVDFQTIRQAHTKGIDPANYLEANDSHSFFRQVGDHLITGPTQTNVMDLMVLLIF